MHCIYRFTCLIVYTLCCLTCLLFYATNILLYCLISLLICFVNCILNLFVGLIFLLLNSLVYYFYLIRDLIRCILNSILKFISFSISLIIYCLYTTQIIFSLSFETISICLSVFFNFLISLNNFSVHFLSCFISFFSESFRSIINGICRYTCSFIDMLRRLICLLLKLISCLSGLVHYISSSFIGLIFNVLRNVICLCLYLYGLFFESFSLFWILVFDFTQFGFYFRNLLFSWVLHSDWNFICITF